MKASDKHEFPVIWRGQHYLLASLSAHILAGIDPTGPDCILFAYGWDRKVLAPRAEIYFRLIPPFEPKGK